MSENIILVGPMGAGKTTIGKLLAAKLDYSFIDTDSVIEERSGADISWIFDKEGEVGFRARESAVLEEIPSNSNMVIATGGGIVVREQNIERLKKLGVVIYITATIDQLFERTSRDKKRPLLQVPNPKQRIEELIKLRDPLYKRASDHTILTDGRGTKNVVQSICQLIESA